MDLLSDLELFLTSCLIKSGLTKECPTQLETINLELHASLIKVFLYFKYLPVCLMMLRSPREYTKFYLKLWQQVEASQKVCLFL